MTRTDAAYEYERPGAAPEGGGARFSVWAPERGELELHIVHPVDTVVPMQRAEAGYHCATVAHAGAGTRYLIRIDGGEELPDPASTFQPEGVHGPSEVTSPSFEWTDDAWRGIPLREYVIYELHIGTFTEQGTLDAALEHLDELVRLGITAVELMPVAQFPGPRNWGYDGVYPYAVQNSYGGPEALKRFVDAAHTRGLAVVLDVVYNHLGPEGCYLDRFGPYFTDRYATPWGRAINFDGPGSDDVRRYFIANALRWLDEFRVDALRLDAVHAIADNSALPFLEELAIATDALRRRLGRQIFLIAESASNDTRVITERAHGGVGMDAQWNDDFHHALVTLLTRERNGYFADYGEPSQLARALSDGFVYQGEHSSFRGRRHGRLSAGHPPERFVVFGQNHDQIGNRAAGDRPAARLDLEQLKLLAAAVLLQPYVPLLFMGEEYGEDAPFAYFVSHSDPGLVDAVRRGRRDEFAGFAWQDDVPDPQDETTFLRSKLDRRRADLEPNATLRRWYRELLALRRSTPAISRNLRREAAAVGRLVTTRLVSGEDEAIIAMNFGDTQANATLPSGDWEAVLDSSADRWGGPGTVRSNGSGTTVAPYSAVVFRKAGP